MNTTIKNIRICTTTILLCLVLFVHTNAGENDDFGFDFIRNAIRAEKSGQLEDARAWIDADPYVTEGVFGKVSVKPFLKTVP